MSAAVGRREVCLGLLGLGVTSISLKMKINGAPSVRPFCRYSLRDGWNDDSTDTAQYITYKAGPNDRSGVPQVVNRIRQVLSITPAFDIYIAEAENNAYATVSNGRKVLVVDVDFLDKVNRMVGTQWSAIPVIAHEVGHHIAGFGPDRHRGELNADYWSGQALQRLGAAEQASKRAILTVGTEFDTTTHPNKYKRADTIGHGWEDAAQGKIDYSFCLDCR